MLSLEGWDVVFDLTVYGSTSWYATDTSNPNCKFELYILDASDFSAVFIVGIKFIPRSGELTVYYWLTK